MTSTQERMHTETVISDVVHGRFTLLVLVTAGGGMGDFPWGDFTDYCVYILGPIAGAVIAAFVLRGHGSGTSGSGAAQEALDIEVALPEQARNIDGPQPVSPSANETKITCLALSTRSLSTTHRARLRLSGRPPEQCEMAPGDQRDASRLGRRPRRRVCGVTQKCGRPVGDLPKAMAS
ncbi:MAG: hypothetical protein JWQ19_662 [Subtercola sp.]|nr:hypothetical protein [Subtercola sp.]